MADSIREQTLKALVLWFQAVTAGAPVADPYAFTWDLVTRDPIDDQKLYSRRDYTLAIIDGDEQKQALVGYSKDITLQVVLEWRQRVPTETELGGAVVRSTLANLALTEIQRRLGEIVIEVEAPYTAPRFDELVIDVDETANSIDIESFDDRFVGGTIFAEVRYKHSSRDPRASVG